MSEYIVKDTELTSIANAIRSKSGGSGQLEFPNGFVSEIGNITGELNWNTLLAVDDATQQRRTYPVNLILPNTVHTLPRLGFAYCIGLISVSGAGVTNVGRDCFAYCSNLTSVSFPSATDWSKSHQPFDVCNNITTWDIPWHDITNINNRAFRNCSIPSALAFPSVVGTVGGECFRYSTSLQSIDFGEGMTKISGGAFTNTSLSVLILRRTDSLVTLENTSALNNSPFASEGTGGIIYIPKILYDHLGDGTSLDYQSATNWSTILGYANNKIKSIESTHTDPNATIDLTTHYADGTEIPTS